MSIDTQLAKLELDIRSESILWANRLGEIRKDLQAVAESLHTYADTEDASLRIPANLLSTVRHQTSYSQDPPEDDIDF